MEMWAWIIAYFLGFALLQLYLYRYFINGQSTTDSSPEGTTPNYEGGTSLNQPGPDGHIDQPGQSDDDIAVCSQCGGYNERDVAFTYCKHCGSRLL